MQNIGKDEESTTEWENAGLASMAARRRLLRAGLGAAPIAMTLASRPVLACNTTKASAFHSFATIGSRAHTLHQTGCKPPKSGWDGCTKNTIPASCKQAGTADGSIKCSTLWGNNWHGGSISGCDDNTTILQLCQKAAGATNSSLEFAQFCAATHLNCEAHYLDGLCTPLMVKQMWQACGLSAVNTWSPTTGIYWSRCFTSPVSAIPASPHEQGCRGWMKSHWT
jgi:hypothetical protein